MNAAGSPQVADNPGGTLPDATRKGFVCWLADGIQGGVVANEAGQNRDSFFSGSCEWDKTGVVFIGSRENTTPISLILLSFVLWRRKHYYRPALYYC